MLRQTADLLERGMLSEFHIECRHEIEDIPGIHMKKRPTGWQTVTIILRGNPRELGPLVDKKQIE